MRCTKTGALEELKKKGLSVKTIIDIGVHRHTPELIKAFSDKKHLLFEPVLEYHNDIRLNYKSINYVLFPIALSDKSSEGFLRTFDVDGQGNITHSSITTHKSENDRQIQIAKLDDVLNSRNEEIPYLIKLDVDGVELQILQGAVNTLKNTDCIIVECPISIDNNLFFERALFLKNNGFILWDIVDLCYYKNELSQVDLFFLKKDIKERYFSPWQEGPFDPTQWWIFG